MTKGERLREMRKKRGLSQTDAAELVGVSKQTLYKYEMDIVTNIPSDKIEALAELYGVYPFEIMGWRLDGHELMTNMEIGVEESEMIDISRKHPEVYFIVTRYSEMTEEEKNMVCRMLGVSRPKKSSASRRTA